MKNPNHINNSYAQSSNEYWNNSRNRKFYISFCLLISAISDFAVGLDLMQQRKLNWSTIANYYSIVHSARTIVFSPYGNYPTSHEHLKNLFNDADKDKQVRLDWLQQFLHPNNRNARNIGDYITLNQLITLYTDDLSLPNASSLYQIVGKVLKNAKKLRENSNYDSLLMSHEYQHETMSNSFKNLADSMSKGAEICLKIGVLSFRSYILKDNDIYPYFVKRYLRERVYQIIEDRITLGNSNVLEKVKEVLSSLEEMNSNNGSLDNSFRELERDLSTRIFGEKAGLMDKFYTDVMGFKGDIDNAYTTFSDLI